MKVKKIDSIEKNKTKMKSERKDERKEEQKEGK